MALKEALGFSLKPVRIERDGASAPPETSALAPPSESPDANVDSAEPKEQPSSAARLFQATSLDPLADSQLPEVNIVNAPENDANEDDTDEGDTDEGDTDDSSTPPNAKASTGPSTTPGDDDLREAGLPAGRSIYRAIRSCLHWARTHRTLLIAAIASTSIAAALLLFVLPGSSDELASSPSKESTEEADPTVKPEPDAPLSDRAESKRSTSQASSAEKNPSPGKGEPPSTNSTGSATVPDEPAPTAKSTTEPATDPWDTAPQSPAGPCLRQGTPKRIASRVTRGFPLEALAVPEDVLVLVGSSEQSGEAIGLQVNATSLESSVVFREPGSRALLGVMPKFTEGKRHFVVDRVSIGGHREWRTLPGPLEVALTRTNRGLHLIRQNDYKTVSLWSLASGIEVSRPQVARFREHRFGITFRRRGTAGDIVIAWLDARSLRRSSLGVLPFEGVNVGLPSIAIRNGNAVIAAATRLSPNDSWRVELTTARWRHPSRRIELPALLPPANTDRFAPKIVSLSGDRWLVQWTEGTEGHRRVRALTLNAAFRPLGGVFDLSPPEESAGGGLLAPVDAGLLSLFLVQKGQRFELWGSTIACD